MDATEQAALIEQSIIAAREVKSDIVADLTVSKETVVKKPVEVSIKPSRDGKVGVNFNQEMTVPSFVEELKNQETDATDATPSGRALSGLESLDVSTIFDVSFVLKGDIEPEDL